MGKVIRRKEKCWSIGWCNMELIIITSIILVISLLAYIFKLKTKQMEVQEVNKQTLLKEAELQRSIRELTETQNRYSHSLIALQQQKQQMEEA